MKKLVSDLTGPELDYFVAKAQGWFKESVIESITGSEVEVDDD